uniref:Major facilitator superfamily (MFS) profile domain-containing protein n=1 Tax=Proboscia inermis TaxID=420281 RepID=A0A7S0CGF3_9STRA|mmetsp:Transcript_4524/g.4669  ORF Transcript_4524/g.4669 Transcript_4524/m.4669 type:complete len:460 (+) Transcript_4524:84-1463(+)
MKVSASPTRLDDPNVKYAFRLWLAYTFLMAPLKDGLIPFVSVFLVSSVHLGAGFSGMIWFLRDNVAMLVQAPIGDFVDKTEDKKTLIFLCTLGAAIYPVTIIWSQATIFLVIKTVLEGIAAAGLGAVKGPIALGLVGPEEFELSSKHTEVAEHAGALVAALESGLVAYLCFPRVEYLFIVIAVHGGLALVCLLLMPTYMSGDNNKRKVICDKLARNQHVEDSHVVENGGTEEKLAQVSFLELMRDKNMSIFALSCFFFHFGNAAVLGLLGQFLAMDGGRAGLPYTSANIAIAQLTAIMAAYGFDYLLKAGYRINVPVFIGFASLPIRITSIVALAYFWPNPYALIATQVFDGIGAGVFGLAAMQITMLLTQGTGRFGVVFSLINATGLFGGAMSNLISGYIVDYASYQISFMVLGLAGFVALALVCLLSVPKNRRASQIYVDKSKLEAYVSEKTSLLTK